MRPTIRGWRSAATAAATATVVVAALEMLAPGVRAQTPATISVSPTQVVPGEAYSVTVTDCAEQPFVGAFSQFSDAVAIIEMADAGGGTWTYEAEAGRADVTFDLGGPCAAGGDQKATLDVENPILALGPILADRPSFLLGTDCPPGTDVSAVATQGGEVIVFPLAPIDDTGDWNVDFSSELQPGPVQFEASCGAVQYAPIDAFIDGEPGPPPTTTEPAADPSGPPAPPAPPATPVSAAAQLTG